jgi:hypothetical protein
MVSLLSPPTGMDADARFHRFMAIVNKVQQSSNISVVGADNQPLSPPWSPPNVARAPQHDNDDDSDGDADQPNLQRGSGSGRRTSGATTMGHQSNSSSRGGDGQQNQDSSGAVQAAVGNKVLNLNLDIQTRVYSPSQARGRRGLPLARVAASKSAASSPVAKSSSPTMDGEECEENGDSKRAISPIGARVVYVRCVYMCANMCANAHVCVDCFDGSTGASS